MCEYGSSMPIMFDHRPTALGRVLICIDSMRDSSKFLYYYILVISWIIFQVKSSFQPETNVIMILKDKCLSVEQGLLRIHQEFNDSFALLVARSADAGVRSCEQCEKSLQ